MTIHPTAIVDPRAEVAEGVEIGPWTYIGPDVQIGKGTVISSHVVVRGPTVMGENNRIFQFASVGEDCQDRKYKGEPTRLEMGDNNMIREGVTIHRGTIQDESLTSVGSGNLLMANTHLAHDVVIGDNNTIANNAGLAGHVKIGSFIVLGGGTMVHQFCKIGSYAMCAGGTLVSQDIPAFVMASGQNAVPRGLNVEGMKRRGFSPASISAVRKAYKILYRDGNNLSKAKELLTEMAYQVPEVRIFLDSVLASTRGLIR